MRRISFIAVGLLLAATLSPQDLRAAGNVLVPSDSSGSGDSSSSLPNLGLSVPAPTSPTPTITTQTPTVQTPTAPLTASSTVQTPTALVPSATALTQTPAQVPVTPRPKAESIAPFTDAELKGLPLGAYPTRVIHQPDMTDALAKAQSYQKLPHSMTISFSGKSFFGAKDVETITSKLGINHDQVSSSCYLSVRGFLHTDKGGQMVGGGLSPQATVHYDGTISNYMMLAIALCTAGNNLPKSSGFLTEIGDRFMIPLQQIKCDAPNRQVSSLTITYDGSGTSQCVYQ